MNNKSKTKTDASMKTKPKAAPSANISMHSIVSNFLWALKRTTRAVEIYLGSCTHADVDLQQLCNSLQV